MVINDTSLGPPPFLLCKRNNTNFFKAIDFFIYMQFSLCVFFVCFLFISILRFELSCNPLSAITVTCAHNPTFGGPPPLGLAIACYLIWMHLKMLKYENYCEEKTKNKTFRKKQQQQQQQRELSTKTRTARGDTCASETARAVAAAAAQARQGTQKICTCCYLMRSPAGGCNTPSPPAAHPA